VIFGQIVEDEHQMMTPTARSRLTLLWQRDILSVGDLVFTSRTIADIETQAMAKRGLAGQQLDW
jgi:hypothetical protein